MWFRSESKAGSLLFPTELKTAKTHCADQKLLPPNPCPDWAYGGSLNRAKKREG